MSKVFTLQVLNKVYEFWINSVYQLIEPTQFILNVETDFSDWNLAEREI